jgi:hypothetical protein
MCLKDYSKRYLEEPATLRKQVAQPQPLDNKASCKLAYFCVKIYNGLPSRRTREREHRLDPRLWSEQVSKEVARPTYPTRRGGSE